MECAPLSGCGSQHSLRALGGTRVLLAAAPTTPPCFRRWRRSSSLHSSHIQRNNYFIFAFVAACGPLQTHFHGRGRDGERHLQRRFLRKRGAVGSVLALSVTACAVPPLPKGEALAKPYTLHFSRKLHRHAKGSPFEERLPPLRGKMSCSDKRGNLARKRLRGRAS